MFGNLKDEDGLQFLLGSGEMLKGWDIGILGMKVGEKRQLTCLPIAAYGPNGCPPLIPRNATIIFEIELIDVK